VAANTFILFQVSKEKGAFIAKIASRDFVSLNHIEKTEDGAFRMVNFHDLASESLLPAGTASKDYVRGVLHIGGWWLEPAANNSTKMTLIAEADLKGSVPKMVISVGNKE